MAKYLGPPLFFIKQKFKWDWGNSRYSRSGDFLKTWLIKAKARETTVVLTCQSHKNNRFRRLSWVRVRSRVCHCTKHSVLMNARIGRGVGALAKSNMERL